MIGVKTNSIPFGTFTVVSESGGHRTIRLKPTDGWATSVPNGSVFCQELTYTNEYSGFCFVLPDGSIRRFRRATDSAMAALFALLTGDYESMGLAYALESGRCWKCGRELTVPASIHRGMGPDCFGRYDQAPRFEFVLPKGWQRPTEEATVEQFANVVNVEAPAAPAPEIWVGQGNIRVRLLFGDRDFMARKEAVKALGFRWDPNKKYWYSILSGANVDRIASGLRDAGIAIPEEVIDEFYQLGGLASEYRKSSSASSSQFVAEGLAEGLDLMPFQRAGVEHVVKAQRVIVADEMGLGKTVQALASIAHTGSFPALVIVPASLKLNWRREAKRWIPGAEVNVLNGTTGHSLDGFVVTPGKKSLVIVNYDILGECKRQDNNPRSEPVWSEKGWGRWLDAVEWGAIVADESHYVKNSRAGRTTAVRRLMTNSQATLKLLLSGTPILNRPVELWPQLEMLGYGGHFGGYRTFTRQYCDGRQGYFGYDVSGGSVEMGAELNNQLRSIGAWVRRLKSDVLTELPEKRYAAVPLSMGSHERVYLEAEADCIRWFAELPSRRQKLKDQAGKEWDDDPGLQAEGSRAAYVSRAVEISFERSMRAQQMVRFEALKHAAWEAKRESVHSWVSEFLEGSDRKLIIFAHHVDVVDSLAAAYGGLKIKGGMNPVEIEEAKRLFQEDPDYRVIVCNIQAGGMGHTLTAASDVAFVEFPWTPFLLDQATDRAHRIGQRDSVTGWLLMAERSDGSETIDGEIAQMLTDKRIIGDAVLDGREGGDDDVSLIRALSARWAARVS